MSASLVLRGLGSLGPQDKPTEHASAAGRAASACASPPANLAPLNAAPPCEGSRPGASAIRAAGTSAQRARAAARASRPKLLDLDPPGLGDSSSPGYPPGAALPTRGQGDRGAAASSAATSWQSAPVSFDSLAEGGGAAPGGVGGAHSAPRDARPAGRDQGSPASASRGARRAPPSSVHNPGITRQTRETLAESDKSAGWDADDYASPAGWEDREHWLSLLEAETKAHRDTRADAFAAKARGVRAASRALGKVEREVASDALWYASRATGQRERFDRIRECGKGKVMTVLCTACGVTSERPMTCGHSIACPSCRARKLHKRRGRVSRARAVVLEHAARAGLLRFKRRGGRHSEKLLTLTLPHRVEHDVSQRIEFVFTAWPHFLKAMNAWLRENEETATWLRSAEWTIGSDAQGHPHVHVWFFGPFLPRELLVDWWLVALERVGFPVAGTPIVDVRTIRAGKVDDGSGIVTEVIKYVTKDIVRPGVYVDAETYARVYEAFDARRVQQASSGFIALGTQHVCCPDCDAHRSFLVRVDDGPWRGGLDAQRAHRDAQGPP